MTWQQFLIGVWLTIGLANGIIKVGRNREFSSVGAALTVVFCIVEITAVALVLSSGGFW
jgi:hypothetical protein